MADDLSANLHSYKLQLQQVEAALTNDPENEELLKLKKDLQEVIELTKELMTVQAAEMPGTSQGSHLPIGELAPGEKPSFLKDWKAGDRCLAQWPDDGQFYPATIELVTEEGHCSIIFDGYSQAEALTFLQLRPYDKNVKGRKLEPDDKGRRKRLQQQQQREWKKKKQQKKMQRIKVLEEEREVEKNKWQDFNSRAFNKTHKGQVKKSIFATPDSVNGRVGVGTCNIGGRPMTEFHHQEKWRRNAQN